MYHYCVLVEDDDVGCCVTYLSDLSCPLLLLLWLVVEEKEEFLLLQLVAGGGEDDAAAVGE